MADLDDIIQKPHDDSTAESVPNPNFNPNDFLKKTTGLDIDVDNLRSTQEVQAEQQEKPKGPVTAEDFEKLITVDANINPDPSVDSTKQNQTPPQNSKPGALPRMTPDMVSRIGDSLNKDPIVSSQDNSTGLTVVTPKEDVEEEQWVKLSGETNYKDMIKKRVEAAKGQYDGVLDSMDASLKEEEERLNRAKEITSDPEKYQELMQRPAGDPNAIPRINYEGVSVDTTDRPLGGKAKVFNPIAENSNIDVDDDDLMPSYDLDEKEDEDKDDDEAPDVTDVEGYTQYIRDLEVTTLPEGPSAARIVKNRQVETVDSGRKNKAGKFLGDQAFMNSITRFKKDNFTVVSVPLINSGFIVDVVGTGEVDLTQLYTRVNEQTSQMDYDMEKMRTIIRNVVGSHPMIEPSQLRNYIHYRDYNMLAWGHICATLDNVEIVANCTDCGKPFRITSNPRLLLMNMDEIMERQHQIEEANDINRYSLLVSNKRIVTSNQFEITIGHPTYAEFINLMGQLRRYATDGTMNQLEAGRFIEMANTLYQIRSIKMPNGVISSNIYQHYLALQMLSEEDMQVLDNEIRLLRKEILEPKFGIASVTCPHCRHVMKDIPYDTLDDLVFFHTTVSRMLNTKETEKPENA